MNSIVPQQNDFDLFAKLIVMDHSIRRKEVDGVVYFAITDVLSKMVDSDRKDEVRKFWNDLKKSPRTKIKSEKIRHIHFGGKGRPLDGGDYELVLYIALSLPDERAITLRAYVANRMAKLSEPTFKYLLRQQSEGKALAAEEIRYLYEIEHLALPEKESADEDLGYKR